ncbi:MAG: vanadium-dependent haloperoxidase [Verrucomicrobiaceae bacterium]|nr:vanadium-dependent haloperoxidase [Verrucomicrobiaceae bacterium]
MTQNGIPTPGGIQGYVGVQGLATLPFSLTRDNPVMPWIDLYGGPSKLSVPGTPSSTDSIYKEGALSVIRASSELNSTTTINISPGAIGNNTLGNDDGTGFATNPITGLPYPTNNATKGDYYRVLAEFWADGPTLRDTPGHWQVLANEVTDDPAFVKQLRGSGPVLNDLEWDVKTYFTLASATHDAACAAWALKRYYSGTRPITMIRYMGTRGQSSNPSGPSYHIQGLPLETDVCEVITAATTATGGKHESIWDMYTHSYQPGAWHIGEIAVKSWPAEHPDNPAASTGQPAIYQSTVRWMLAKDWVPFQRKTFNTPAFPGYISGHSTFSRAAAEALTLLTGTPNFPGGFHHHTYAANSMLIDLGPAAPVDLQWCTYYDAADQAGQSRRWGGIHVPEDDYHGRVIGAEAGTSAATLAFKYFDGSILTEALIPEQIYGPSGTVTLTCPMRRGLYCHWEYSTDLQTGQPSPPPLRPPKPPSPPPTQPPQASAASTASATMQPREPRRSLRDASCS